MKFIVSYCYFLIIIERVALLLRISAQSQRKEADMINVVKMKLLMKEIKKKKIDACTWVEEYFTYATLSLLK